MYMRHQVLGSSISVIVALLCLLLVIGGVAEYASAANDSNRPAPKEKRMPEDFPKGWPETLRIWRSDLPLNTRFDRITAVLESESIEVALQRLDEYHMYGLGIAYDFTAFGGQPLPLKPEVDRKNVFEIVLNRRFIKLVDRLSSLSKAAAAEAVGRELAAAMKQYDQLWEEEMQYSESLKQVQYRIPGKPTRALQHIRADGGPTLLGVRMKILALLMLAGNLQLESLYPTVTQIVEKAMALRNEFYTNPVYNKWAVEGMLSRTSLYQRQVLATAMLGTAVGPQHQEEVCKKFGTELKRVNPIEELRERADLQYGPDRFLDPKYAPNAARGSQLTVVHVGLVSDSQFDGIIAEIAKIRADGPPNAAADLH